MHAQLDTYATPDDYRHAVDGYLRAHLFACNQLFAGIQALTPTLMARRQSWLARLHRHGQTCGIALINSMLPARVLSLSDLDDEEAHPVADALSNSAIRPTAIVGPQHAAEILAACLTRQGGASTGAAIRLGNHILSTTPAIPSCAGNWRAATLDDIDLLVQWRTAFMIDCGLPDGADDLQREIRERIVSSAALFWLWEVDGGPVAMALGQCLPPVGRIGMVYSMPSQRGHGYAGALVAHVSRQLLAQGCEGVFLFTDMGNPVSNGVYRRIGYRLLGEQLEVALHWPD